MKTIILGGGPSGLGVAWGLVEAGHRDIVIVEKADHLGGLSGSFRHSDCVLDFGPHRFSPEYPELITRIKNLLGDELLEVPNEHAVVFQKRVYRYPPVISDFLNFSTFVTTLQVISSFLWMKIRKTIGFKSAKNLSFEEIVVGRFGQRMYDLVIQPMCLKVWGNPSTLDPDFADLRFSVPSFARLGKKILGSKEELNDKVFYYPRQGFQQLWDYIADHLKTKGVEIRLSTCATEIKLNDSRVESVTLSDGIMSETLSASWLVSTIPSQQFIRLLKPNPLKPTESFAHKFADRGMLLVLVISKQEKALPARVVLFPEAAYCFNRLSEQNQFSQETVPTGHSAILADILVDVGSKGWNEADDKIIDRVVTDIEACGFLKPSEFVEAKVFRVPIAYPLPTIEREQAQKVFNSQVSQLENVLCTGRFASSDYNNSHTALRKGLFAAQSIVDKKELGEWYLESEAIRKTAIRD